MYTQTAYKLSATGLWDEAKECYAGALQSLSVSGFGLRDITGVLADNPV